LVGQKIDQYEILEEIGSGGMGTVYRARDISLDRFVAIKVLSDGAAWKADAWSDQLKHEAQAAAKISSPNVVTIHQVSEDSDPPYIVMELVEGKNLRQELRSRGSFAIPEVIRIASQVCDALTAAHEANVLHKDIKPENIILSGSGIAKVMDFGIARLPRRGERMEEGSGPIGTAAYMSPEQVTGNPLDERTDLYSLGVVMYEMLTGRLPHEADTVEDLLDKKIREVAPLPSDIGFALPGRLESLVMKALENDPELRFSTAREMRQAILSCAPASFDFAAVRQPSPGGVIADTVTTGVDLVGRDGIVNQLADCLARAKIGAGTAAVLSGETGVGKTAILNELHALGEASDFIVLRGRCLYQDMPVPFYPYVSAIRALFESPSSEGISRSQRDEMKTLIEEGVTELRLFLPYLETVLNRSDAEREEDVQAAKGAPDPSRIFAALGRLLAQAAQYRPVLLTLDDFQWVDRSSLQLFHYLGGRSGRSRIMLVAAYRPEDMQREPGGSTHPVIETISRMEAEGKLVRIEVPRLSKSDTSELLRGALRNTRFTEEFKSEIYDHTLGNPVFVLECLKSLREDGTIKWLDGHWQCVESIPHIRVPKRAKDAIERRLECLGPEERRTLSCASVQGCTFTSDVLGAVLGMERLRVLTILNELEKKYEIVRFESGSYTFDHPLLWQCSYDALAQELRQEYHLLIARYLDSKSAPKGASALFSLANHYYKGCDYERALPYLEESVKRAKDLHAHSEALVHLEKALEALGHLEQTEEMLERRLGLLEDAGWEAAALGDWKRALARYEEARGICTARGDVVEYARLTRLMGKAEFSRQNWTEAQSRFSEAMSIYANDGQIEQMGELYLNMGSVAFELGEMDEVADLLAKALEIGEALGDKGLIARASNNLGAACNVSGDRHGAIQHYQKCLENSAELEDRAGEARAYHNIGLTYSELKNWSEAAGFFRKAAGLAEELNDKGQHYLSILGLAEARVRTGSLKEGEDLCEHALAAARTRDDKLSLSDGYKILGMVRAGQKRYEEAAEFFNEGIKIAREVSNQLQQAEGWRELGLMLREKGDTEAAADALGRAREVFAHLKAEENVAEIEGLLNANQDKDTAAA
jgi:predicted ATPase